MINQLQKKVLILALFAGETMMKSGAEIYRVEETIVRICRACKIDYVECFATPTGITLSVDSGHADGDMHTFIKRIRYITIDLQRISKINEFSRVFTTTDLSIDDGFLQLKSIAAENIYPLYLRIIGAVFIGATICPLFNGTRVDMIIAGIIAGIIYLMSEIIDILKFPSFIRVFISCAICAALALICHSSGITDSLSPVIISGMTIFLPGIAITNAARDMVSGDFLSGVSRFTEGLLHATGIAGGVGVTLKIWSMWGGEIPPIETAEYPMWQLAVFSFICILGFCVLFHSPPRTMVLSSLAGAIALMVYQYMEILGNSEIVCCFTAACTLAIIAEFGSRAGKDATTIFIIPGIIPLVPGALLYATMSAFLANDMARAAQNASATLMTAFSIAAALVFIASFTRLYMALYRRVGVLIKKRTEKIEEDIRNENAKKDSDQQK